MYSIHFFTFYSLFLLAFKFLCSFFIYLFISSLYLFKFTIYIHLSGLPYQDTDNTDGSQSSNKKLEWRRYLVLKGYFGSFYPLDQPVYWSVDLVKSSSFSSFQSKVCRTTHLNILITKFGKWFLPPIAPGVLSVTQLAQWPRPSLLYCGVPGEHLVTHQLGVAPAQYQWYCWSVLGY